MATTKPPTTFSTLPAELRNRIYHLSGSLNIIQIRQCGCAFRADEPRHAQEGRLGMDDEDIDRMFEADQPALIQVNTPLETDWTMCKRASSIHQRTATHRCVPVAVARAACSAPELARVSKEVRADTLPMYYGKHTFHFRLFHGHMNQDERDQDETSLLSWLSAIGARNASLLRNFVITFSKDKDAHYIRRNLQPQMAKLGVRVGEAVKLVRTSYPHCSCVQCVRRDIIDKMIDG
ncbi:hypothetical protein LTR56_025416 [Elasticomyces elasticus]|nr:hypothetical protein LTR56_025416 [Elasticomyces elasticus]KAK3662594.1 hypothetical protein LTR22_006660 [Elasticomyces elasticus]KAK4927938.1 hypothetical protein LTR49_005360 [Elasticomyces elasticus]KAK5738092.1 hypothetical protein LTS12_025699 [Elasticomyces elasticus]